MSSKQRHGVGQPDDGSARGTPRCERQFTNPTILTNDGTVLITGRSIVNDRVICDTAQEMVPDTETIRTRRAVLNHSRRWFR
jgi:hypothetical protein